MSFNLMMVTAWSMVQIYEQYKKMTGNGVRYMELLDTLDEIEQQEQTQQTSRVVEGNLIEFKNVNIFTPTKNKLVHDLSFQVGERDSMLLTGHNGAGKSSVRPDLSISVLPIQEAQIAVCCSSRCFVASRACGRSTRAPSPSRAGATPSLAACSICRRSLTRCSEHCTIRSAVSSTNPPHVDRLNLPGLSRSNVVAGRSRGVVR